MVMPVRAALVMAGRVAASNWHTAGHDGERERGGVLSLSLTVAVFCGSSSGNDPAFRLAAEALGTGMARAGIRLVYGGGRIGLMGALADAVLAGGGEVVGVLPDFLRTAEIAHDGLTQLEITGSMHARKLRMFELADAFVALPGGIGTLDETIEILTWRQLGLHSKPVLICNVAGSAEGVVGAVEGAIALGFAAPGLRDGYAVIEGVPALLARLAMLRPSVITGAERL
jgi:uncharacterized protein (TIGR00730 family)